MNQARTYVYIVIAKSIHFAAKGNLWEGGGALFSFKLMGMCRWMDSHFHDSIDYNWVIFLKESLDEGCAL